MNKQALTRYTNALRALDDNAEWEKKHGIDYETDEYLRLNAEVAEAEQDVPWWRRR